MKIKLTSNIYGKTELSGKYEVSFGTTIEQFADSLGVQWNDEALIVVKDQIVESNYLLQEGDCVYFLTPIVGG